MDAVHAGVRWEVVSHILMKTEYAQNPFDQMNKEEENNEIT
jgi:hypothetical protein